MCHIKTDSFAGIENRGEWVLHKVQKKRGFNVNTTTVKERQRERERKRGGGIEEETVRQARGGGRG